MHSNHCLSLVTAPRFRVQNKQTAIIFRSHSLFCPSLNSLPPFMPSSFFFPRGQEQSPALMGAPPRIELNSQGGWKSLAGFTILALPPFTSLFPPHLPNGIPALRPTSRCSQMESVLFPPRAPVICPAPRPGSSLKDYILGRDLNYIACPRAPSARLIILVLWDENLELLFSSYHSRHLQVLSVDKCPTSLHDWEQGGN